MQLETLPVAPGMRDRLASHGGLTPGSPLLHVSAFARALAWAQTLALWICHVLCCARAQPSETAASGNIHEAGAPAFDKEAESLRHINSLLQGRDERNGGGVKASRGLYNSPHNRLRVHIKVPSPWEPNDLELTGDFKERLSVELGSSGFSLVGVAVRRGCIEIALDVVMVPREGTELQDSAFEGMEQHPCTLPLETLLHALALPACDSAVSAFWAGRVLTFRRARDAGPGAPWQCDSIAADEEAEEEAAMVGDGGAAAAAAAAAPRLESVEPLCLVLPPAVEASSTGGDAAAATPLLLRLVLRGAHLGDAGTNLAARGLDGYLPTTATPLPDGTGVELLVDASTCHPGLLQVECRDAAAVVVACRPVLLAQAGLADEVCAALQADVDSAREADDSRVLRSVDDLLTDLGAWYDYVHARCNSGAAAASAAAASPAGAAAFGAAALQSAVSRRLCNAQHQTLMRETALALLAEALDRRWMKLAAAIADDLGALGQSEDAPPAAPFDLRGDSAGELPTPSPAGTSANSPAAAAAAAAPADRSSAASPAPATALDVPHAAALWQPRGGHGGGGGELRLALRALIWGFSPPQDEALYVRFVTLSSLQLAGTWLFIALLIAAFFFRSVVHNTPPLYYIQAITWGVAPLVAAWLYCARRGAFVERREQLMIGLIAGRLVTRALTAGGLPSISILCAVCSKGHDIFANVLLPTLGEQVRLRIALPLHLLYSVSATLVYRRLGMYDGHLLSCAAHAAVGSIAWLVVSVGMELTSRVRFLRGGHRAIGTAAAGRGKVE